MNYAIILAGGVGSRAGGSLPKQFYRIGGHFVMWYAMEAFRHYDSEIRIVVVMHLEHHDVWRECMAKEAERPSVVLADGGKSRQESVANGLERLKEVFNPGDDDVVMIHDGARPLVSVNVIKNAAGGVGEMQGAVPVIVLSDSIRELTGDATAPGASRAVDRNQFRAVQTPQAFRFGDIYPAYKEADLENPALTDDASVAERYGIAIQLVTGEPANMKITHPEDFAIAELRLKQEGIKE